MWLLLAQRESNEAVRSSPHERVTGEAGADEQSRGAEAEHLKAYDRIPRSFMGKGVQPMFGKR